MTAALVLEDVQVPRDTTPDTEGVEYPCEVCGRDAGPYGGRGRKPRFCPDHKTARKTSEGGRRRATSSLVEAATDKLVYLNGLLAMGALLFGYPRTAGAFAASEDVFRVYVADALASDDKLCRTIVKTGQMSGGIGLAIAYGTLGANIVPIAMAEYRDKQAERENTIEGETV